MDENAASLSIIAINSSLEGSRIGDDAFDFLYVPGLTRLELGTGDLE